MCVCVRGLNNNAVSVLMVLASPAYKSTSLFLAIAGDIAYIGDSFPIGPLMTILQAVPLCAP